MWKSDGTAAGTVLVKDIYAGRGSASPGGLTPVNQALFFSAGDATYGHELWKTDGTAAGTVRVKNIRPGAASSSPDELASVRWYPTLRSTLFFSAVDASGYELWRSNGTPEGTVRVADIEPGSAGSFPAEITRSGNYVFFSAQTIANGWELYALKAPEFP